MEATAAIASTPIRMTPAEMRANFPDSWVLLVEVDGDPVTLAIRSGVVLGHGKTTREARAMARPLRDGEPIAWEFTGRPRLRHW